MSTTPKGQFGREALPYDPLPRMDEFLVEQEVNLRSQDYLRSIKKAFAHFGAFAKGEGIQHPDEIRREHLIRFQAYLDRKEGLSRSYKQQLMKYLRVWINWMADLQYISENPWYRIKVGASKKQPKPLEEDEIAQLFAAHRQQAFRIDPFAFHRREVILALLYGWGLRIHELQSLNVTQMDMRLDWVMVRNKGGGLKPLPYSDQLKQVVQRWLRLRASHAQAGEDALIIDGKGGRLSLDMIRRTITELGKNAGISINPHRLRDTFGTHMLDDDVPVERLMRMMGHTNRSQTLAYARVNDRKVAEDHARAMNPRLAALLGSVRNTSELEQETA